MNQQERLFEVSEPTKAPSATESTIAFLSEFSGTLVLAAVNDEELMRIAQAMFLVRLLLVRHNELLHKFAITTSKFITEGFNEDDALELLAQWSFIEQNLINL